MDIGKPKRTYTVEPVEDPLPQRRPDKVDEPSQPAQTPVEPEKAPTGV
jgi:hypothetical protein